MRAIGAYDELHINLILLKNVQKRLKPLKKTKYKNDIIKIKISLFKNIHRKKLTGNDFSIWDAFAHESS